MASPVPSQHIYMCVLMFSKLLKFHPTYLPNIPICKFTYHLEKDHCFLNDLVASLDAAIGGGVRHKQQANVFNIHTFLERILKQSQP